MPTVRQIIRNQADLRSVPFWIVEKDYASSYLPAGITVTDSLADNMVLKGGTALRKSYFKDYRFSEDLDFSTLKLDVIPDLEEKIEAAIKNTEDMLQTRGPFRVQHERLTSRDPHPAGQSAFTVHVQFPYHRRPLCRLKIEIAVDEPVMLAPEQRLILHEFPESIEVKAQVYTLPEIAAEKLRALLQSRARLEARGWGTGSSNDRLL